MNWYVGKLYRAAWDDAAVALAFLKVINLIAPPSQLLHPATGLRVLWGNLRPRRQAVREGYATAP